MIIELPLTPDPSQRFTVQLGRVKYELYVKFNSRSGVWTFDLAIVNTKAVLLQSVPIVLGADLLLPYNFDLGRLIAVDTSNRSRDAAAEDLGTRVKLVWFSVEEG